jgi:hypothetical protein
MSQLTDLTTEGTVKADTTTRALKASSIFTPNTKMSTTISTPPTHIKTSKKTTNINTTEMIITASDASHNLLEMAPSFSTGLRENISMVARTSPSSYSRKPEITIPQIPSLKTKTIPNVNTLTVSSAESDTISWITHALEITSAIAKTTKNASQVELDSKVSTATSSRGKDRSTLSTAAVSSAIPDLASIEQEDRLFGPTISISSSIPDMKNLEGYSSKEDIGTSKPILTHSPSEPYNTISLISHAGGKTDSPMSTIAVSPDVTEIMRPLFTSSGRRIHTRNPTQGQSVTTSWITHPGTEATSRVLTTTISPNNQEVETSKSANPSKLQTTTSLITDSKEQPSFTMSTLAVSLGVIEGTPSPVINRGTERNSRTATLDFFLDLPETTTSWTTNPEKEAISGILTTKYAPSVTDRMTTINLNHTPPEPQNITSLATHYVRHSLITSTKVVHPDIEEVKPSQVTSSVTESHVMTSNMAFSPGKHETINPFVTHPRRKVTSGILTAAISPSVTNMMTFTPVKHSPSEPQPIESLDTNAEGHPSASMSTQALSPGMREMMIPQAPNYGRETYITTSTLPVSVGQIESTASLVTHAEKEATLGVLPTTVSTISPNMMASTELMSSGPHTTASLVTHNGEQHSSDMSTLPASSGITKIKQSLDTTTGKESQSVITTLAVSLGIPKTKSINTTSNVPDMMISKSWNHTSSNVHTITSLVTHAGTQSSFSKSTKAASPSITKLTASLFTDTDTENVAITALPTSSGQMEKRAPSVTKPEKETISDVLSITTSTSVQQMMISPTVIPSEPHTTVSFDTHVGGQPSSTMSILPVTSDSTKIISSLGTRSGTESHSVTSTMDISQGQLETTASGDTHTEREGNSLTLSTVISTSAPDIMTSTNENQTSSDRQTIISLLTLAGEDTSLSVPSQGGSPGIMKVTPSLFTDVGTEGYAITSTLPVFSGQPDTRTPWDKHSETKVTTVVLPTTISTSVPEIMTSPTPIPSEAHTTVSLITHAGGAPSLAMSTLPVSGALTENIPSKVTYRGKEGNSVTSALDVSWDQKESTAPWVSYQAKEGPSEVLSTNISTRAPDMVFSTNKNQTSSDTQTMTSLITQTGEQTSLSESTQGVSSAITKMTQSIFNDLGTESYEMTSTLPASSHQSETRTKWITHSKIEQMSGVLSTTNSSSAPKMMTSTPITSELHATVSLVTHVGAQHSSTMSALTASPGKTEIMPSEQTHTGTEIHSVTSTLDVSAGQEELTTAWVTQSEKERTSGVLSTAISLSVPNMTSATLNNNSLDIRTITAFMKHPAGKSSLSMSTEGISPRITEVTPSLFTDLGTESYAMTSTMPASSGQSETRKSWNTNSEMEATPGVLSTSITTNVSEMITSSTSFPSEPHTTVSLVTQLGGNSSSPMSALPASPGRTEIKSSLVTYPDTESYSVTSTLDIFTGEAESTTPASTHTGREGTSETVTRNTSTSVPDMMTSITKRHSASNTQIMESLVDSMEIHHGGKPSLSVSSQHVTPDITEVTQSLFTNLGYERNTVIPTLPVSPGQPDTQATWVIHSEKEATSRVLPTSTSPHVSEPKASPTDIPSEPQNTVSLLTQVGGQSSSAMYILQTSTGRTKIKPSVVTQPGTESFAMLSTPDISQGQTESATPWPTHPPKKGTSEVLSTTISNSSPATMTSITKNQTSFDSQNITSFITHAEVQPSLSVSMQDISTGKAKVSTSQFTDLGRENCAMTSMLPALSGQVETKAPWDTNSEMEGIFGPVSTIISSSVPEMMTSPNVIPSEPHTKVPLSNHDVGQPTSIMSTLHVLPSIPEFKPKLDTSYGAESQSLTSTMGIFVDQARSTNTWATHTGRKDTSGIESRLISTSAPEMMTSITKNQTSSETKTITPYVIQAGGESTSGTVSKIISTSAPEKMNSVTKNQTSSDTQITHAGEQPSLSVSTQDISPRITEVIPSEFTDIGPKRFAMTSTLPASPGQAETNGTITPWNSNSEMEATSGPLSTTILPGVQEMMTSPSVFPSEQQTTVPLVSHYVGQPTSVMSTLPFSPGRTENMPSLVSSSGIQSHSVTSIKDTSVNKAVSTTTWATHTGRENTSGTESTLISTSAPETITSITKHQTSADTQTIMSFITHPAGQPSLSVSPYGASPGITVVTPSQFSDLGTESYAMASTLPASPGQAESKTPWDTHSEMEATSGPVPTTISPGVLETMTSPTVIPSEPPTKVPLVTHVVGPSTSSMSTLHVSPGIPEITPSVVTSYGPESHSATSTQVISIDQAGSTTTWSAHTGRGNTSGTESTLISSSGSEMMTSIKKIQTSSETQTITSFITHAGGESTSGTVSTVISTSAPEMVNSLTKNQTSSDTQITHAGEQPSLSVSTQDVSPRITEVTPSEFTDLSSNNYAMASTLPSSPGLEETKTPWNSNSEMEATSGHLSTTISHGVPQMMTATTVIPSQPHSTLPIVTHIPGQQTSVMSIFPFSPGRTERMPSLFPSPSRENHLVSSTQDISIDQAVSTTPWPNHTGNKITSGTKSTLISTSSAETMTSITKNQTSSATQTSFISHAAGESSLSGSTYGVSFGITQLSPSQFTDLGTKNYAMTSTFPASPSEIETKAPWNTNSKMEASSGPLSTTISSGVSEMRTAPTVASSETHTKVALVTHIIGQLTSVGSTLPFSSGKIENMPSLVSSSGIQSHSGTSIQDTSVNQAVSTTTWATHTGRENTSGTESTLISTSAPETITSITKHQTSSDTQTITSFITHSAGQPSLSVSPYGASPGITVVTPSQFSDLGTESNTMTSTLPASPGQAESKTPWDTHSEMEATSGPVPTTISPGVLETMTSPTVIPSEPPTKVPLVTHVVGPSTSSMSTLHVSPGIPEISPSVVTSYVPESLSVASTMSIFIDQAGSTTTWSAQTGRGNTSGTESTLLSTSAPELMTSLTRNPNSSETEAITSFITHPGEESTSGTVSTIISSRAPDVMTSVTKNQTSSETQTITSFITHHGGQPSLSVSTQGVSPRITVVTPSEFTDLSSKSYAMTSSLPTSPGLEETKTPWVSSSELEATSGPLSTTILPGVQEMMTSPSVFPSEQQTTVPLVSHYVGQPTSVMSTLPFSPGRTESIPSVFPSSGTESHSVTSTQDTSIDQAVSITPWSTLTGRGHTLGTESPLISTSAPETITSITKNGTSSDTQTITSFITHHGGQPSLSVSTQGVSPGITEVTLSQFTDFSTKNYAMTSTLPASPGQAESKTLWNTNSEMETNSGPLSSTISSVVQEMMTSPTVISSEPHTNVPLVSSDVVQSSSSMSTLSVSPGTPEITPSVVTSYVSESHSLPSTLPVSSSQSKSPAQWITHTGHEGASGNLSPTISPSVPEIMTVTTLNHTLPKSLTITSLSTQVGVQPSLNRTTTAFSPSIPKLTSLSTNLGIESHHTTVSLSPSLSETIASLVTHSQKEASLGVLTTTIPSTILDTMTSPSLLTSESYTTISLTTPLEGQPSSSMSTLAVSPGVTEKIPLLVTSSSTNTHSVSSTLHASPGQLETPALMVTPPEREATSSILRTDISPSIPDLMASKTHNPSEHTTISSVTYVGGQSSPSISTLTKFPSIKDIMTPLATTSVVETHKTAPTLSVPADQRETTALWVIHSGKELMSTVSSPPTLPGDSERTETWLILSAKTSTPHPTITSTFSYNDITSSVSEVETSSATTLSSGASEEAASLSGHTGTETSTSTLTVTPSSTSPGTTGLQPSSPSKEYTLTMSSSLPVFPDHSTTSKFGIATSKNIETSPSLSTVRLSDFVSDVISPAMTLSSESSTHAPTDLETTRETTHSATTSSKPTGDKTTTSLHESSSALLTTRRISTLSPENVTSRPSKHEFFIVVMYNVYVYNVNIPSVDVLGVQFSIVVCTVLCITTFSFQAVVRFLLVTGLLGI